MIATIEPRPYQRDAVAAVHHAYDGGIQRPLIGLPTGTGKTIIFSTVAAERPGRTLVLAHRDELVRQAFDKLQMVIPGADVGVVKASEDDHDLPLVVASVQTLARPKRLERVDPNFMTVIVDEAHHATAESYRRVLDYMGAFDPLGPLTLGVTATPERADGTPLGDVWEKIVYQRSILEMIEDGYLVDLRATQIRLAVDFRQLHTRAGDFIESESEAMLMNADAPAHVVEAYLEHASDRKALIFTPTVRTAHIIADLFVNNGVDAEALDGMTPMIERRGILARLRSGETSIVVNCGVLTEGFDEPSIDCIIVARPTKSRPLYMQMIGRGTRLYPGKADCLILDLVGASTRHDLMTVAALFGLRPDELKAQTVADAVRQRHAPDYGPDDYDGPAGNLVASAVDLFSRRSLRWVNSRDGRFVLSTGDGWIALEPAPSGWDVVRYERDHHPVLIAERLDLGYAQGLAEDHARQSGATYLLKPDAPWRLDVPSEKQVDALRRMGVAIHKGLTKGEASDLISAMVARRYRRAA